MLFRSNIEFNKKIQILEAELAQTQSKLKEEQQMRKEAEEIWKNKLNEKEEKCKEIEKEIFNLLNKKQNHEEITILETKQRLNEAADLIEKMKNQHSNELIELRKHYEVSLQEIKLIHEQEKENLIIKLERDEKFIKENININDNEIFKCENSNNDQPFQQSTFKNDLNEILIKKSSIDYNLPSTIVINL